MALSETHHECRTWRCTVLLLRMRSSLALFRRHRPVSTERLANTSKRREATIHLTRCVPYVCIGIALFDSVCRHPESIIIGALWVLIYNSAAWIMCMIRSRKGGHTDVRSVPRDGYRARLWYAGQGRRVCRDYARYT